MKVTSNKSARISTWSRLKNCQKRGNSYLSWEKGQSPC